MRTNKEKIGIITMFYNSTNYGGILQAYALVKYLDKLGYDSEQICYDMFSAYPLKNRVKKKIKKLYLILTDIKNINTNICIIKHNKKVKRDAMSLVPHSTNIYTENNIKNCINNYSTFITGSDQVWHGEWPAYFLKFVPATKKKIAYAVSTGKSKFSKCDLEQIKEYSKDFLNISVREKETLETFQGYMNNKQIELVLDPTQLLSVADWNEITSSRKIDDAYLFCYFLGSNKKMRALAVEFARRKKLKIVTIPHMQQCIEPNDIGFGDIQIYDAGPQDFLSYIKYADAVFTDSFHASLFSNVFQVQYYVFSRLGSKEMDNRIITLTDMLQSKEHFIDNEDCFNLDYILNIQDINYTKENVNFVKMQKLSYSFIERALCD